MRSQQWNSLEPESQRFSPERMSTRLGSSSTMPTTAAEPPARDNQQRITLLRETRPMHRGQPHKLLQIGVTPIPATTSRRNAFIELVGFSNG